MKLPKANIEPWGKRYLFSLPEALSSRFDENDEFVKQCNLSLDYYMQIGGLPEVSRSCIYNAVREVFKTGESVQITAREEEQITVSLVEDHIEIKCDQQNTERKPQVIPSFMFLHPDCAVRILALDNLLEQIGPTLPDYELWRTRLENDALSDSELSTYFDELSSSQPAVMDTVLRHLQHGLRDPSYLVPFDIAYYERLCGKAPGNLGKQDFISKELLPYFSDLLKMNLKKGLALILPSGIHSSVMVRPLLTNISDDILWDAIEGLCELSDPISLLSIFDLSLERATRDERFRGLAVSLLNRMFADKLPRTDNLDIYSLFPILLDFVQTQLRLVPGMSDQPDYWRRLCAWSHCGQLIRLLDGWKIELDFWRTWLQDSVDMKHRIIPFIDGVESPFSWGLMATRLHLPSFVAGQIESLLPSHREKNISSIDLRTKLQGKSRNLLASGHGLFAMFPGPLELDVDVHALKHRQKLTEEMVDLGEKLSTQVDGKFNTYILSHLSIVGLALPIPSEPLDKIVSFLSQRSLPQEDKEFGEFSGKLCEIAILAAICRNRALAEAVLSKCLEASSGKLKADEVWYLLLAGLAASGYLKDQSEAYLRFGSYLKDFVFMLQSRREVAEVGIFVEILKNLLPLEMWYFSEAEALICCVE